MDQDQYVNQWKMGVQRSSGIRGKSREVFRNSVLSLLSSFNTKMGDRFLRALFTHTVFDDQKDQFEEIIIQLKQSGTFIDTDTLLLMLEGKKEIDGRYFHLSFDDGFKNIYTNALPILQKHEIPALFFVPSSLVGANWEQTRHYCLETTHYRGVIEMVNWDDLRKMASCGIEIGSHTKNHTRFSTISKNSNLLKDEIQGSKQEIEANLGLECRYIAWPYGIHDAVDNRSLEITRDVHYKACFGGYRGSIKPGETDRFQIPRHYFETQWPISHIKYFARGNFEG